MALIASEVLARTIFSSRVIGEILSAEIEDEFIGVVKNIGFSWLSS